MQEQLADPSAPGRPSPPFQFRLLTLLSLTTLFAIFLGLLGWHVFAMLAVAGLGATAGTLAHHCYATANVRRAKLVFALILLLFAIGMCLGLAATWMIPL